MANAAEESDASPIVIPKREFDSSFLPMFHASLTSTESECGGSSDSALGSSLITEISSFSLDACSTFALSPTEAMSILRSSFLSTLLIDLQWHKRGKQKIMVPGARIVQDFLHLRSEYEDLLSEFNDLSLKLGDDDIASEYSLQAEDDSKQLRSIYSVFDLSTILDYYFARRKDAIVILYDETGEDNSFSSQLASIISQEGISKGVYYIDGGAKRLSEAYPKLLRTSLGAEDDEIQIKVSSLVSKIQQKITIYTLKSRQDQLINAVWYGINSDIPARILPGLFLGSCLVATSKHVEKLKITHILRFGSGFENHCQPSKIYHHTLIPDETSEENSNNEVIYYDFPIEDIPTTPINTFFHITASIITSLLAQNKRILVHCHAGVSRSATIILAFLMIKKQMSLYEAWNFVFVRRPIIRPNEGFAEELRKLDEELKVLNEKDIKLKSNRSPEVPIYWMSSNYAFWIDYLEWKSRIGLF
ncbi:hypothetical protein HK096_002550 [Nowakowskiella sp. JEL0078]|nr:hypothetical protein HK096_002550 [Nowakowskiella sp. JEL0078]